MQSIEKDDARKAGIQYKLDHKIQFEPKIYNFQQDSVNHLHQLEKDWLKVKTDEILDDMKNREV